MNCLQTASRDLSYGMSLAEDWIRQTGGSAARHCMAVAEAAVGDPSAAARSFAQIAQELPGDRWGDIGQLWAQAGHAWLLAEQPPEALEAFNLAVEHRPDDAVLLADRAVTKAMLKDYRGAVGDLTRAIEIAGANLDYLLYRATAYRYLNQLGRGLADLDAAIAAAPAFAEAYLELGNQRVLSGDAVGAVADFQQVLDLAPDSDIAPIAAQGFRQFSSD